MALRRHEALSTSQRSAGTVNRRLFNLTLRVCAMLAGLIPPAACGPGFAADKPDAPSKVLRWGGDQEGGGPYIFSRSDELVGFEVDLAGALGREMGRGFVFVQSDWDEMLLGLSRGDIDLALNGYEFTVERGSRYLASLPYY